MERANSTKGISEGLARSILVYAQIRNRGSFIKPSHIGQTYPWILPNVVFTCLYLLHSRGNFVMFRRAMAEHVFIIKLRL